MRMGTSAAAAGRESDSCVTGSGCVTSTVLCATASVIDGGWGILSGSRRYPKQLRHRVTSPPTVLTAHSSSSDRSAEQTFT
jgi:hypothetical protein